VALPEKKSAKLWIWRAYDVDTRRAVAWVLGGRDDATCRRLLDKVGLTGMTFVTDDWEGYHRVIPPDQLFSGKGLTFPIDRTTATWAITWPVSGAQPRSSPSAGPWLTCHYAYRITCKTPPTTPPTPSDL